MLTMDVFSSDAFSATSLIAVVERLGYVPTTLQSIPGLTVPEPVRTEHVWIEARSNAPALIQTTVRGAPPKQKGGDIRNARAFSTKRLALGSRISASELQNIRAFGSETELKQLQDETARRLMKIKQDFTLTKENWLLGMVQGVVTDADGTTIYNWLTEFGQSAPTEEAFNISNSADVGAIRGHCNNVRRTILRNLQGLGGSGVDIVGLCDDVFWDALVTAKEVRNTYLNWTAAADLRNGLGQVWSPFRFGDISFINYRGTDDNSTVAIPSGKCKFFPTGSGIFRYAMSPGESFEWVNTPGQEYYPMILPDRKRNAYADLEMYSYPLPVCVQPQALMSGRAGA